VSDHRVREVIRKAVGREQLASQVSRMFAILSQQGSRQASSMTAEPVGGLAYTMKP